ncbi:MAG: homocysteine S-methyltransferase family protein [Anaerolineae bacterium]|nr:homocysteine S-methyltransferase family protein [Anaerolineae bacterium]
MSNNFLERLHESKPLLLDGAMGTELTRRGVDTRLPLWSAGALVTNPEVVKQIHIDYLTAGADIITTNTFRTHARNIRNTAEARRLTHLAVQLAKEAVQQARRPAFVAGSVAPLEDCYSPHLTPHEGYCQREQAEMVSHLAEAGVDVLLIETMNTVHEAVAAARPAHYLKIPYMVSFVTNERHELLSGESLQKAVDAITPFEPAAFLINCIPTHHIAEAVRALRACTDLPIGAYGNMGTPDNVVGWASADNMPPEAYCFHAETWLMLGLKIVGSCCGSTPAHTAALRQLIDRELSPAVERS